ALGADDRRLRARPRTAMGAHLLWRDPSLPHRLRGGVRRHPVAPAAGNPPLARRARDTVAPPHARPSRRQADAEAGRVVSGIGSTEPLQRAKGAATLPAPQRRALLTADGLTKRFGGVAAVQDCSFAVPEGTITALVGPNGSGKTTLFNLLTGYLRADAGSMTFADRRFRRPDPTRLYRAGLTRTFQQARIFPKLTPLENLAG